jgi:hypothetical protein
VLPFGECANVRNGYAAPRPAGFLTTAGICHNACSRRRHDQVTNALPQGSMHAPVGAFFLQCRQTEKPSGSSIRFECDDDSGSKGKRMVRPCKRCGGRGWRRWPISLLGAASRGLAPSCALSAAQ